MIWLLQDGEKLRLSGKAKKKLLPCAKKKADKNKKGKEGPKTGTK